MKKTYTINLSGKVFHIDEDALEKLQNYINALKTHYAKEEDGAEIMYDIESRIAELFLGYQKEQFREVIMLEDVYKIISTMGKPNDIIEEEDAIDAPKIKQSRRLYRDPNKQILGGVAAGLGAYWGISRILIRILFILFSLFYGIFILVYIILWIVIPRAKTSKEKLEMKGKDINISNIERSIKEEVQEREEGSVSRFLKRCGKCISKVFNFIGRVITIFLGIVLFFGSLFLLCLFLMFLFLPNLMSWEEAYNDISYFLSGASFVIGKIAVFFMGIIPILLLIFGSVKMLFSFRSNNKLIFLSSGSLWFISLIILVIIGFTEARSVMTRSINFSQNESLKTTTNRITIDVKNRFSSMREKRSDVFRVTENDSTFLISKPYVRISRAAVSKPEVIIEYYTNDGKYLEKKNKGIDFNWTFSNDTICYDDYFKIEGKWRKQDVRLVILIPEKFTIILTPEAEKSGAYISEDRKNR